MARRLDRQPVNPMSTCAWCLRYCGGRDEGCQFPGTDQCRTERRLEDMAHAINNQYANR